MKVRPSVSPSKAEIASIEREQELAKKTSGLIQTMIKDYEAARRRKKHLERIQQRVAVQSDIQNRREELVRMIKFQHDNELERASRNFSRRSREEGLYRDLFTMSLKMQKQRIIEEKDFARERKQEISKKHAIRQKAIEDFYLGQYSMLKEELSEDMRTQQIAESAQKTALKKMEAELKRKMKDEIALLKEQIKNEEELSYFRRMDPERLYKAILSK